MRGSHCCPSPHLCQVPELELMPLETPQDLPLMLVHGTFWQHWPSIRLKGLSCRGRTHIHLATGLPGDPGVISGQYPRRQLLPPTLSSHVPPEAQSHPYPVCSRTPFSSRVQDPSLPVFDNCNPRCQLQLSLQACGQTAKWPWSSMGPWRWQVSADAPGAALGLREGLGHRSGLSADGIPFFRSVNGVILTPGNADGFLLPKYFKEALQLQPTRENPHSALFFVSQACILCQPQADLGLPFSNQVLSISGKPLSLAGDEETECQNGPQHSSRGRRMSQQ